LMFIRRCWPWLCLTWKLMLGSSLSDEGLAATPNNCDRWLRGCSSKLETSVGSTGKTLVDRREARRVQSPSPSWGLRSKLQEHLLSMGHKRAYVHLVYGTNLLSHAGPSTVVCFLVMDKDKPKAGDQSDSSSAMPKVRGLFIGWSGTALLLVCWIKAPWINSLSFRLWAGLMCVSAIMCFYEAISHSKWFLFPAFAASTPE